MVATNAPLGMSQIELTPLNPQNCLELFSTVSTAVLRNALIATDQTPIITGLRPAATDISKRLNSVVYCTICHRASNDGWRFIPA